MSTIFQILNIAFLLIFVWSVCMLLVLKLQDTAYEQGDYQRHLSIIKLFRFMLPSAHLFFRGTAYHQLGRLEQAERDLRWSLAKRTGRARRTVCREELGLVLLDQARYEEAQACFNQCVAESPSRGGGHRGIAETILRRGEGSASAVQSAQRAVDVNRAVTVGRGKLARKAYQSNLAESLGVLAWAHARNAAEIAVVENDLSEAFRCCPERVKPVVARLNFYAGQAYNGLGNSARSKQHFQLAAQADPLGSYGRLARVAIGASDS